MNRGDDTKLFVGATMLFAVLSGLSFGLYLPYGREKDATIVLQALHDGVAVYPTYGREALFATAFFMVMAILTLVFALDNVSNRRIKQAANG